ncbi:MAG: PhnD/SsuA/transferrin family substrate-binding protein [Burkholderiales bacterium]|nr:PhnD/SsuA/transferrin family substrate-binding protein [Burkholderiales bacterium]
MKKTLFFLFLYFFLTVHAMAMNSLRLGIEESVLLGREEPLVKETVAALKKRLEREIIVNVFSTENLKAAVENNEVDLFISSASFFSSMGKSGVKDLATAVSDRALDPNYGKSTAVFIRAKGSNLSHLEDLKERKVFFNPKYGEENLFLLFGELGEKKNNLAEEYEIFKKGIIKKDISIDRQIEGLLHGDWDAVILPGCQLETESEKLPISSLAIDVLQPKIHSNLRCVHSTALYPNITIGTLPSVSASLSRQLSIILLSLPPTKQGMLWGTASDFSQIDKVLRLIDRDANASDRKWSFSRVLAEYWFVFLGALGLVIGLLLHSVRSEHLVQKRTAQLTASLKKQEQLKKQAVLTEEKLGKLQRLGTISQMSSLFAHELRQPLNAIRCYTFSLTRLLKKRKIRSGKISKRVDRNNGTSNQGRRYYSES